MKKHDNAHQNRVSGTISINSKGVGYVKVTDIEKDPEVDHGHLNTALNGDEVIIVLRKRGDNRVQGEVVKVITRAKNGFSGVLEQENRAFFLKPDDTKMYTDILIPEDMLGGARNGDKAYAEIIHWTDPKKAPEGKITKVFGKPGDNDTEMHAIAMEKGFDNELPDKVEQEARKIRDLGLQLKDYKNRRDFREVLTFTIDPADAKDFDDAISFKKINEQDIEIGIHIADVTHYVKSGSEIDREAKGRGTSVYLVDRTIPMLPEILSNDLCSLLPNTDRFTMSAVFVLDNNAKVKSEWYGKTVIHSKKRFTYEEAENAIKNKSALLHDELKTLNDLAKKMIIEKFENGAISLDQEEVKFVLDEKGVPVKIIKKERGDANRLIEEFMLLANKKVAEKISKYSKDSGVFLYRVHDAPSKEKTADLAFFLRSLGYKVNMKNGVIPSREINSILETLRGKSEKDTVHRMVIRSMAKAIYSTKNIGHYGLAFKYYTHFTSPIRRYPDMLVHRFLESSLAGRKIGRERLKEYEEISIKTSLQEKNASDAERSSIKYKQVEYMSARLGQTFDGVVSGVSEWGIYVEELNTKCEGMIRVKDMKDDFYVLNEKRLELVGEKNKKKYRLGDKVKMKVKNTDLERKLIDYVLI